MQAIKNKLHLGANNSSATTTNDKKKKRLSFGKSKSKTVGNTTTTTTTTTEHNPVAIDGKLLPIAPAAPVTGDYAYTDRTDGTDHSNIDQAAARENLLPDNPIAHQQFAEDIIGTGLNPVNKDGHIVGSYSAPSNTNIATKDSTAVSTTSTTNGTAPAAVVRSTEVLASTLPSGSTVERIDERTVTKGVDPVTGLDDSSSINITKITTSIPVPPPAPSVWTPNPIYTMPLEEFTYQPATFASRESSFYSNRDSSSFITTRQELPREIIEKPVVIHETIRREQIEEVQPVIHLERERTEIRQITQPLFDKEVRPVTVEQRSLPEEFLPVQKKEYINVEKTAPLSTRSFEPIVQRTFEMAPIIEETERLRIIEEVTPVIYKETVIPTIIKVQKPIREVIIEAPTISECILAPRQMSAAERSQYFQGFGAEFINVPAREFAPIPTSKPTETITETKTTTTVIHESHLLPNAPARAV